MTKCVGRSPLRAGAVVALSYHLAVTSPPPPLPSPSPLPLCLQDFDDWGDVGLNIPKPPGLVQLFRNYHKMTEDRGEYVEQLQRKLSSQTSQILALQRENETLTAKVRSLER